MAVRSVCGWKNTAVFWWRYSIYRGWWLSAPALVAARLLAALVCALGAVIMAFLFKKPEGSEDPVARQHAKLKGYYELVQDILNRAETKHRAKQDQDAAKLYRMGLTVCEEALAMEVAHSGIANSNVGIWRSSLTHWQQEMSRYLRLYESGAPTTSISPLKSAISSRAGSSTPRTAGPGQNSSANAQAARVMSRQQSRPLNARQRRPLAPTEATKLPVDGAPPTQHKQDSKLREMVLSEVLDSRPSVSLKDVAGLDRAKQALQELVILPALRADLFTGIRSPAKGLLLYGPPGNGKTMLARALASEASATFFNLSASSLTSRWMGEGEKLVRTLFEVAREMAPSVIFLDEIDSILSARSAGEHEASRRLKTEFLVQFDGMAGQEAHVVVIGATNRPQELDDAVRRRLEKRIYIPLPDRHGRLGLLSHLLASAGAKVSLTSEDLKSIALATHGYSGADLAALCREAAMQPLRELGTRVQHVKAADVRPINVRDFAEALRSVKPSVDVSQITELETWTRQYGTVG